MMGPRTLLVALVVAAVLAVAVQCADDPSPQECRKFCDDPNGYTHRNGRCSDCCKNIAGKGYKGGACNGPSWLPKTPCYCHTR